MSTAAKYASPSPLREQAREFAQWAVAYDQLPNPLLGLEERFLCPLLPELKGKAVLDVGCGTGRWLKRLERCSPASLSGIDFSPEMLDCARRKLGREVLVAVGNATSLPIADRSADVVIASFVTSYVPELENLAKELRRVLRPGGRVYLSDMHPGTAAACHWKRGFRNATARVEPLTWQHSLHNVTESLRDAGFSINCLLEPAFGLPELEIFRSAGKLDAFYAAAGLPAIYIIEACAAELRQRAEVLQTQPPLSLRGARVALDGDTTTASDVYLKHGCIETLTTHRSTPASSQEAGTNPLHLQRCLLLAGLINAHDHLEFGLYPNLGHGPYQNAAEWARDIQQKDQATIQAHRSVPREVRLWWGAIRNLLSGVTTVCHHNDLHPELLGSDFPVRVVTDYGWAHSPALDPDLARKLHATPTESPFVFHACEGVDATSAAEILELDQLNALDNRTVLVHGLALTAESIALLNTRAAAVVWCPSSNRFLFGRTHSAEKIGAMKRPLLGSDSPLTASGDLLDEIRIAHSDIGISARELYRMIFETSVEAFRLKQGQGRIRPGAAGDLIAVRDTGLSPAETVVRLKSADIELVIVGGRVQVASDDVYRRLPSELATGLRPIQVDGSLRWIRAPLARLFREAERVLGCTIKVGGKRVRHVCSAWM